MYELWCNEALSYRLQIGTDSEKCVVDSWDSGDY